MRWRRVAVIVLAAIALSAVTIKILSSPRQTSDPLFTAEELEQLNHSPDWYSAPTPGGSVQHADPSSHPIQQLLWEADVQFQSFKSSQSKTLVEAVGEYKRRYGVHPPPLFDKWYEFAVQNDVKIIDDYDTIYHSLLPFWALDPKTLRSRVDEALGFGNNAFLAMLIRNGGITFLEGGPDWQQKVTRDMMDHFIRYLPDMNIAFNIHDEPRVVIPHDELSQIIGTAKQQVLPAALAQTSPRNSFSVRPTDMNNGRRLEESKVTRFNEFAHQAVWVPSRLSCSANSRARDIHNDPEDDVTSWAFGEPSFIHNQSAYSDICQSPSYRKSHGFFDRPNAYKIAHELIPVFSQSKVSSYQDILYPSPWYWYGKTVTDKPPETHPPQYNESLEYDWKDKEDKFYWRGTTTGGFSRAGGWRRQHRQRFVHKVNALDNAKVLTDRGSSSSSEHDWKVEEVPRAEYNDIMDIKFTGVGQCDPGDCDAQREFFDLAPPAFAQDAWKYKFLLDIDGNAFSGRFYAFLRSKSLPFKAALFREWHDEWLKPWMHFIPLSLQGDEALEAVRYFAKDKDGATHASRVALQGRQWAKEVLRNVDLEAWLFRLLLEYGRLLDDDRANIGFAVQTAA